MTSNVSLRSRLRLALDALRGRVTQSVSSLQAQMIASALQASVTPTHPLRVVCDLFFVRAASDITYFAGEQDYEHVAARVATESTPLIARTYITTGGVLLYRRSDDTLAVVDWSHVTVASIGSGSVVMVDGRAVVDFEAITFGDAPLDSVRSPAHICEIELALDSAAKSYAYQVLHADPYYSRMLVPREQLSELAVEQLAESLNARGRDVRGQLAVLPIPMDVVTTPPSVGQLGIDDIAGVAEATVAAVYGIPIQLLGLSSSSKHQTYANREQASRDFTERVLVPFWRRVARAVGRLYGVEVTPDLDSVAALKADYSDYATKLYDGGNGLLTRDEARALLGYDPLGDAVSVEQSRDDFAEWYQQSQEAYTQLEQAMQRSLAEAYAEIARKIHALPTKRDQLIYIYSSEFASDLRSAIERAVDRYIPSIVEQSYRAAHRRGLTYSADPREVARRELASIVGQEITQRLSYTIDTLRRQLDESIEAGVEPTLDLSHAAIVARTMATGLVARVQTETWRAMERTSRVRIRVDKMWMTQRDERVRHTHEDMDGVKVKSGEDFRVPRSKGGYDLAQHPADSRMSAENVINCRCVVVPRTVKLK